MPEPNVRFELEREYLRTGGTVCHRCGEVTQEGAREVQGRLVEVSLGHSEDCPTIDIGS